MNQKMKTNAMNAGTPSATHVRKYVQYRAGSGVPSRAASAAMSRRRICSHTTDYPLTPQRFQPGYEVHLSRPSLAVVYGALGVGLALGAMLSRRS